MAPAKLRDITRGVKGAALVALAFFVPVLFFPWTVDALDINKQTLTILLVTVALVLSLVDSYVAKSVSVRKNTAVIFVGLFAVTAIFSSFFSVASLSTSVLGQGAQEYTSLFSLIIFLALFVIGTHAFEDVALLRNVLRATVFSSGVVGIFSFALFAHVLPAWFPDNTIGSPNALAIFLTCMAIFGCSLWLANREQTERDFLGSGATGFLMRGTIVVTVLSAILVLLAIDYSVLWIIALGGVLVLFALCFYRAHLFPRVIHFFLPMLICVLSLLFLFAPTVLSSPFAPEVAQSYGSTFDTVRQGLNDTSWIWGAGPGSYSITFAKFHPKELNATALWDTVFDRGSSAALTGLLAFGVLGTIFFALFVLGIAFATVRALSREKRIEEYGFLVVLFPAWCVLLFAAALYSTNFTLVFLFWLLSSMLAAHVFAKSHTYALSESPRRALGAMFASVLFAVVFLTLLFAAFSRYRAEIVFAKAVALDRAHASLDDVIANLDAAAVANKWNDATYRNLAHALLLKTADIVKDPNADPNVVKTLIGSAVNAALHATSLSPHNVQNLEMQGTVYREIAPVIGDASAYGIASFERAVSLAPNNPRYYVGLARTYIVEIDTLQAIINGKDKDAAREASTLKDEELAKAVDALKTAQSLKGDYIPAVYYLALVEERQGKLSDAILSMENVRAASQNDVGVSVELALLYLRQGKNALAKAELNRAIGIAPNFANAHWYLSAVLEQEGDVDGAIAEAEKVKELNPDNALVTQRLERLKNGQKNDALPVPVESGDASVTDVKP